MNSEIVMGLTSQAVKLGVIDQASFDNISNKITYLAANPNKAVEEINEDIQNIVKDLELYAKKIKK